MPKSHFGQNPCLHGHNNPLMLHFIRVEKFREKLVNYAQTILDTISYKLKLTIILEPSLIK